jgi:hypothetical protein
MTPAAWGFTDRDRAQIRAKEAATLERLSRDTEKVIASPPLMHSAIGKAIEDPRNPGTYLINETVRIAAIRERRLLSESYRRLTGADLGTTGRMGEDEARASMNANLTKLATVRQAELADIQRREAELTAEDSDRIRSPVPIESDR